MSRSALGLVFVATVLSGSAVDAQVVVVRPWWWGGWGYPYRFSSTLAEGARRGLADVIRARGQAYEARARGLKDLEEARSKYIENKQKWIESRLERKRLGQARRREEFEEKRAAMERYLAQKGSSYPPRLSPSELDPTTGKIYWPDVLMKDDYAELRREIEELLLLRAHTGASRTYASEIHEKARAMQAKLKEDIRELPAYQFIAANNFLDSLAYEGRYPVG